MLNTKKPLKRPEIILPPKKHIMTVAEFYADNFDEKVNNLIDNGYTLIKREVIVPNNEREETYFYAELEKVVYDYEQVQSVDG